MSRGVHVFGASSMGALRAAELAAFGMVGFGRIYDLFRTGHSETTTMSPSHTSPQAVAIDPARWRWWTCTLRWSARSQKEFCEGTLRIY